jgi:hypothetical protein
MSFRISGTAHVVMKKLRLSAFQADGLEQFCINMSCKFSKHIICDIENLVHILTMESLFKVGQIHSWR